MNEHMIDEIKSMLQERFGIDVNASGPASRMRDLGIDSLHMVDLMLDMESAFGFQYEALTLPANPSLEEIADAIAANSASAR
ncbi:acyl carrier protein [Noviherbaspirillum sp. 1P10PC]|uniref:acyl carrier protein n=1 Tax=Noviherbaspirillum sp. 1P10PC TaxID=3132292 RepID=UPI0039A1756A